MKGFSIGLLVGAIVGSLVGFAAGISYFPILFPSVSGRGVVSAPAAGRRVAAGAFVQADLTDPAHYGAGRVSLYQDSLRLEEDFAVGPGPKYHVYLVPEAQVTPDTRVEETMFVDLGRLKAFSGSQDYAIPDGMDLSDHQSVVIWSEQLNLLISPAPLKFSEQSSM